MTIRVAYWPDAESGIYVPRVVCDVCGDPIRGGGTAWWLDYGDAIGEQIWHTHWGDCGWGLDGWLVRELGGTAVVCDEDLDTWLAHVVHNTSTRRRRRARTRPKRARH